MKPSEVLKVDVVTCPGCGRRVNLSKAKPLSAVPCPCCRHPLHATAHFGQFELVKLLGSGPMAKVFQGIDRTLKRHVAIKVILDTFGEDEIAVNKCLEEARALAALNHHNVVQIYSVGMSKGRPYIVMELVDGGRFDQLIVNHQPADEVRILELGIDVAEGLRAAWGVGLIHGDIKPENILIDRDGVTKLVDFGIARYKHIEHEGQVYGTPQYVAPEVALKQKVDHRADIFSLGATLFHALTGRFPYHGQDTNEMIMARLDRAPIDPRVYRPELSATTAETVVKMLQPHPRDRHPGYEHLLDDLRLALSRLVDEEGPEDRSPAFDLDELDDVVRQVPVSHRGPGKRTKRKKSVSIVRGIVIALIVFIGLGGLIALLLWGASIRV